MKKTFALLPAIALTAVLGTVGAAAPAMAAGPAAEQAITLRLEPLGDSITYGTDSSTGNGYRGDLYNELTTQGYPLDFVGSVQAGTMADSDNEGHPGWRIDQIAAIANSTLATYKPNVITLMIGTNDMVQNYQESTAPARLSALIDQIMADDPTVTLLVSNLTVGTNAGIAAGEPAYNAAVPGIVQSKDAAGEHVVFVNMDALTTADISSDGIHPNDNGYQLMADAWDQGIQTAAANGWIQPPVPLSSPATAAGATGSIFSGMKGNCLDDYGASTADGTAIQLYPCNGTAAQSWTAYSDGSLRLGGKCLDATNNGTADGTLVELWDCNASPGEVWQAYNGGYVNLASGKCLDDPAFSTAAGTRLQLWDCNGGTNQQWGPPGVQIGASGTGQVTGYNGFCLDDYGDSTTNGAIADVYTCNGTNAQKWTVTGTGTITVNGSLCLDIVGAGSTANGSLVDVWGCNGGANQVWQQQGSTLVNPQSGKCLDDPAFSTTPGTQLDIWQCNGGANQNWVLP